MRPHLRRRGRQAWPARRRRRRRHFLLLFFYDRNVGTSRLTRRWPAPSSSGPRHLLPPQGDVHKNGTVDALLEKALDAKKKERKRTEDSSLHSIPTKMPLESDDIALRVVKTGSVGRSSQLTVDKDVVIIDGRKSKGGTAEIKCRRVRRQSDHRSDSRKPTRTFYETTRLYPRWLDFIETEVSLVRVGFSFPSVRQKRRKWIFISTGKDETKKKESNFRFVFVSVIIQFLFGFIIELTLNVFRSLARAVGD